MGEMLRPSKLARSEMGRTAVTPVKRSNRAWSGPTESPAAASLTTTARLAVARGGKTTVLECRVCEVSVTSKVLRTLTYHDFCDMGFGTFLESKEIF